MAVVDWALVLLLVVLVAAAIGLAVRRLRLGRSGGTVECGLRSSEARPWRLGLAAYQTDSLHWYSAFGLRMRPNEVFCRSTLSVLHRRPAAQTEAVSIGAGTVVLECQASGPRPRQLPAATGPAPRIVELAMSQEALTGFLAWLEATPPGPLGGLS